jgi:hypothetical protein
MYALGILNTFNFSWKKEEKHKKFLKKTCGGVNVRCLDR